MLVSVRSVFIKNQYPSSKTVLNTEMGNRSYMSMLCIIRAALMFVLLAEIPNGAAGQVLNCQPLDLQFNPQTTTQRGCP